jgi:hypothetical protein
MAYTSAAGARISIRRTTASSTSFGLRAHVVEPLAPERVERCAQLVDSDGVGAIKALVPGDPDANQAGVSKHAQVLGGGRLAEAAELGDLSRAALAVPDELEHRAAARVGDSSQGLFHGPLI